MLVQVKHGKKTKHQEGDNLLDGFQLRRRKNRVSYPVRRDLKAVFDKRDEPAYDDDKPYRDRLEFRCPYHANVIKTFEQTSRVIAISAVVTYRLFSCHP